MNVALLARVVLDNILFCYTETVFSATENQFHGRKILTFHITEQLNGHRTNIKRINILTESSKSNPAHSHRLFTRVLLCCGIRVMAALRESRSQIEMRLDPGRLHI